MAVYLPLNLFRQGALLQVSAKHSDQGLPERVLLKLFNLAH